MLKKIVLNKIILAGTIAAVAFSTSAFSHSDGEQGSESHQREFRGKHHQNMRGFDGLRMDFSKLDLTDQQQVWLKQLKENNKASLQANFDEMRNLKEKVRPLLEAETIDENAVKNLSIQIADLKAEQMIKMAMLKKQIFAFLTEEQKARFEELQETHKERRQAFREKS